MTIFLGIDPGLQHTGWGAIQISGNAIRFLACGTIHSGKAPLAERLLVLHEGMVAAIERYAPHAVAIEETFVNTNAKSSLLLGHARGAVMLSASLKHIPVFEYAATLVKKTVVGVGRAEKNQVEMMVRQLLPGALFDTQDAADALAVAICHHSHSALHRKLVAT